MFVYSFFSSILMRKVLLFMPWCSFIFCMFCCFWGFGFRCIIVDVRGAGFLVVFFGMFVCRHLMNDLGCNYLIQIYTP